MSHTVCDNCRGFIFKGDIGCKKCKYNKEHFILTPKDMEQVVKFTPDMDDLLFQLGVRWQRNLTDPEIRCLADVYYQTHGGLDNANKLYVELDHMNNMVIT